ASTRRGEVQAAQRLRLRQLTPQILLGVDRARAHTVLRQPFVACLLPIQVPIQKQQLRNVLMPSVIVVQVVAVEESARARLCVAFESIEDILVVSHLISGGTVYLLIQPPRRNDATIMA